MAGFQPVVFRLDNEKYGLDISTVNAIEHNQSVVRVPNAAANIKGIMNLRGEVVPVYDLRSKFNTPNREPSGVTEYIIINLEKNKIAIEVDSVEEIHTLDTAEMIEMPLIAKGEGVEYFENIAKIGNDLIIIVNPYKLLSEAEQKAVDKLIEDTK